MSDASLPAAMGEVAPTRAAVAAAARELLVLMIPGDILTLSTDSVWVVEDLVGDAGGRPSLEFVVGLVRYAPDSNEGHVVGTISADPGGDIGLDDGAPAWRADAICATPAELPTLARPALDDEEIPAAREELVEVAFEMVRITKSATPARQLQPGELRVERRRRMRA